MSLKKEKKIKGLIMRILVAILFVIFSFYGKAQNYSNADIPDAMTFLNGEQVKTIDDLKARQAEIKKLWCDYVIGHFPKEVPKLLSAKVVKNEKFGDGSSRKRILLTFDTPNKKSFEIAVWEPQSSEKPRPLLLTQPRRYQRMWAEEALKRGYVTCIYPGLDAHNQDDEYPDYENVWKEFKDEYPEASWGSSLGIQAWLAGRSLDYL